MLVYVLKQLWEAFGLSKRSLPSCCKSSWNRSQNSFRYKKIWHLQLYIQKNHWWPRLPPFHVLDIGHSSPRKAFANAQLDNNDWEIHLPPRNFVKPSLATMLAKAWPAWRMPALPGGQQSHVWNHLWTWCKTQRQNASKSLEGCHNTTGHQPVDLLVGLVFWCFLQHAEVKCSANLGELIKAVAAGVLRFATCVTIAGLLFLQQQQQHHHHHNNSSSSSSNINSNSKSKSNSNIMESDAHHGIHFRRQLAGQISVINCTTSYNIQKQPAGNLSL